MKETAKGKAMRMGEWCAAIALHVLLGTLAIGLMGLSACMLGMTAMGVGVGRLRA